MRRIRNPQIKSFILFLFICLPLLGSFELNSGVSIEFSQFQSKLNHEESLLSSQNNIFSSIPSDLMTIKSPLSIDDIDINESFEARLNLINPLNNSNLKGTNIKIAILDSGINETNWISNDSLINRINVVQPNAPGYDNIGHGSLVGSIVSKIVPEARILSIKVTDDTGTATVENIEEGIILAISYNVSIIHASLGSKNINAINSTLISLLTEKNITLIVAAGNSGPFGSSITSPAILNEVIAVGMAYNQTYIPTGSSVGPRPSGILGPDIVAPGVYIPSYINGETSQNVSGTSFASPFVTASVAMLLEAFPKTSPTIIKAAILSSASFIDDISPTRQGSGFLNMERAYLTLQKSNETPILTITPRKLSSEFKYFGQSINGQGQNYTLGVYSSINCNLTGMDISTLLPIEAEIPDNISSNLLIPINRGFNMIKLTLLIPQTLPMELWEGTINFDFNYVRKNQFNFMNNYSINIVIPVHIENRYPGGRILFYQGYDNDSFIPDGPTGRFSQLHYYLEDMFGMQVTGAIRSDSGLSVVGPLQETISPQGHISANDLENFDILVLADIEMGLATEEIKIIHDWVGEGHSLLILSYPSFFDGQTEFLSNQTSINTLLELYDISIEEVLSEPKMNRFSNASLTPSNPIGYLEDILFDYNGTYINTSTNEYTGTLATATNLLDDTEDLSVAGFWHNPDKNGKVVVFGSLEPFTDLNFYSDNADQNFYVASQTFRWLLRDQETLMELNLAANPSVGTSTKIQISFPTIEYEGSFNGTIVEANGLYSQIVFEYSVNTYVGTWKPKKIGTAVLWVNLNIEGAVPSNGLFILTVYNPAGQSTFLFMILGSFLIFGVVYYLISSRRSKPRLTLQEQLNMQYKKPNAHVGTKSLEPLEICSRCRTPRHGNNSRYCFKCGKEL